MTGTPKSGRKTVVPGEIKRLTPAQYIALHELYLQRSANVIVAERTKREPYMRLVAYGYAKQNQLMKEVFTATRPGIDRLLDPKKLMRSASE